MESTLKTCVFMCVLESRRDMSTYEETQVL